MDFGQCCVILRSEMHKNGGQAGLKIQLLNSLQTNHNIGLNFALWVVSDRMKEQGKTVAVLLKIKHHPF